MTYPIDEMPNLSARLGKAKCDRIRMHQMDKQAIGTKRTRWISNPHQQLLQSTEPNNGSFIDDILNGIASLDSSGSESVSATRLHVLLAENVKISSDLIIIGLKIDARQARRYMAAAKLAIFHISRHRKNHDETQVS